MTVSTPAPIRSKQGCWTCRLRKKKCDERRPSCERCSALTLPCHGYGPKPLWMDGGAGEREMTASLRRAVMQVTSRKREIRLRSRKECGVAVVESSPAPADIAPNPDTSRALMESEISVFATTEELVETVGQPSGISGSQYGNVTLSDYSGLARVQSKPLTDLDEDEGCLLMHYLDHVFPLQFPFYKPSVASGGRGWLLVILMRTKPLYHAALSLALYHSQIIKRQTTGQYKRCCLEPLEKRHLEAISELRYYLDGFGSGERSKSLVECIEVLACMALLISSEVFRGDSDSWEIHLRAAASLLVPAIKAPEMILARSQLSQAYTAALHFFIGVIVWYDNLSCATTGLAPFSYCPRFDESLCYTQLELLMGCENWAMLAIRDISTLSDWKSSAKKAGKLSVRELVNRAEQIQKRLEEYLENQIQGMETTAAMHEPLHFVTVPTDGTPVKRITTVITTIFASAALVHLHVIVSGPHPALPEIQASVDRTISAIRTACAQAQNSSLSQSTTSPSPTAQDLIHSLKWPICIAGSMASTPAQQEFFRGLLLQAAGTTVPVFGSWNRILAVLEQCWSSRSGPDLRVERATVPAAMEAETPADVDIEWRDVMKQRGWSILLV